ncbi:Peptidase S24, LexA-like, conserved region [Rhizobium freirei PRF 81]|uniref:Peptidase S24, LexA-like, conserved region n=2 Tax=Rhizobium freirei TaxID=1353277 RepID=N6U724_9HYPH|nr:Peptidase S24, LexA-like, conserved region [Rhizobium freirei PRF 81]
MGYSRASSIQRYEDPVLYKKEFLAPELVLKMVKALVGRGEPPISASEIWALARPEVTDPDSMDFDGDARTAPRVVPKNTDEVRELDARAGAGGGGVFDLINVTDDYGNQISAEVVKDHWQIPTSFLRGELRLEATKAVMIEITGDSGYDPSNPNAPGSVFPGDRVIVDARDTRPSPPGPFLVYDGTGFVVKLCEPVHGSDPPTIRLASRNPIYTPYHITIDDGHVIVGRVVGRFTRM